jgi:uncharacterized protein YycO
MKTAYRSIIAIVLVGLLASLLLTALVSADSQTLYMPSTLEYGVTFNASSSGTYRITIVGGAWSPWPEGSPDDQGWKTGISIYKNRPVVYMPDPNFPGKWGPVVPDYGLGDYNYHSSYQEAEAAGIGLFIDIPLNTNDYLVFLTPDHLGWYYHNRGGIYFLIENLANQPPVASFKSLNVIERGYSDEETFDGGHMVGGVIRFDPTASYDPDGEITEYEWDFDNGTKFSTGSPNVYDITFGEARVYNVKLTVTDNNGSTNTFEETLDLTLKDGDLIFIRTAWWDIPFNLVGNEYTHVGMYIGGQWMIESILSGNSRSGGLAGVVVTPLSGWSYPGETYATLVRVKTADDKIRQEAVAFALSKSIKGQGYDWKVWQKSVNQPDYYCSELIWAAYYKASKGKIDLGNTGKKGAVWPDDIMNDTANTQIVGYHWEHNPL